VSLDSAWARVVTVWEIGGIYTPNPRDVFTFLPIHFHLTSALLEPLTSLFSLSGQRAIYATQASPNRDRHASAASSKVPQSPRVWSPPSATNHWIRVEGPQRLQPSLAYGEGTFERVTFTRMHFSRENSDLQIKEEVPEAVRRLWTWISSNCHCANVLRIWCLRR